MHLFITVPAGVTKCGVHAGEKEAPRAAAKAISRKEAEPKQTGRAARESKGSAQAPGAAEAPNAAKEAAVRASQPELAVRTSTPAKSEASSQHLLISERYGACKSRLRPV